MGEGEEVEALREMFENLLITSMDRNTTSQAHPAFVSMISQLTPDEAWILKSIDRNDYAAVDVYDYTETKVSLGFRTLLGVGSGIDETRLQQYITNLDRLGILRIDWSNTASDQAEYDELSRRVDAELDDQTRSAFPPRISSHGGVISVTPFGWQFLRTCVQAR